VQSAYKEPPRKPITRKGNNGKLEKPDKIIYMGPRKAREMQPEEEPEQPTYNLEALPLPEPIEDGGAKMLKAMFDSGDRFMICRADIGADGREHPSGNPRYQQVNTLEWFLSRLEEYENDSAKAFFPSQPRKGLFLSINPLQGEKRKKSEIAHFRHALVEFDNLPLEQQWSLIRQSNLPCSVVLFSGKRSVHAIVRVDADDEETYKQRVRMLMEHFRAYGVDAQNVDASRLCRLADGIRGDTGKRQDLLAIDIGASSFSEWHAAVLYDHDLPPKMEMEDLFSFDRKNDPDNMIGERWLCKGASMIVQGPAGIGKSSLLMHMALNWGRGCDVFGIKPVKPLKTLVIQAENDLGDLGEELQDIIAGMNLKADDLEKIKEQITIYRDNIHTSQRFVKIAHRLIQRDKPDLVFVDPLLSFCGDDISSQRVAGQFLRNWLGPVLMETGVVWIWIHHTGKPSSDPNAKSHWGNKETAYSGLGSSELVNWAREVMTIMPATEAGDVYSMTLSKRAKRSGLVNKKGEAVSQIHIEHGKERIEWLRSDYKPSKSTKKESRSGSITGPVATRVIEYLKEHGETPRTKLSHALKLDVNRLQKLLDHTDAVEIEKRDKVYVRLKEHA
jgi:RecA-family ATPase